MLEHALAETWYSARAQENLDLKEKLRVSLERREKLLKEIQQVKRSPDFPQDGYEAKGAGTLPPKGPCLKDFKGALLCCTCFT